MVVVEVVMVEVVMVEVEMVVDVDVLVDEEVCEMMAGVLVQQVHWQLLCIKV